jgi:glycosyltransferase involved in cell wall biosynthesis
MKIAYVVTRGDAVGGASVHVRDLARAMLSGGHEVLVLVGGRGSVTEQLECASIPYRSLRHLQRSVHPWRDARAYSELKSALAQFAPDLVSTHTAKAGWLGRAAARALRLPAIYTPHGWTIGNRISRAQGEVYTVAERIAAPWARAIVCVSQAERQIALEKQVGDPDQLRVIHNGVRDIPLDLRACPEAEPVRIVSVARFEPPKDHRKLLLKLAAYRNVEWELDLAGDGPLKDEIRDLALSLGLSHRVNFLGYVTDPATVLARAQIFVLSSRSEAFPRSILEAMRAGLPVVASSVGGVPEAVEDGVTGRLGLDGLGGLITDAQLRQKLGANGRRRFEQRFVFERTLDLTWELYREAVR